GAWRTVFLLGGIMPLLLVPAMVTLVREGAHEHSPREATPSETEPRAGDFQAIFAQGRALPTTLLWASSFLGLLVLYLLLSWLPILLVGNGFTQFQAVGAQIAFNVGGGLAVLLMGPLLEGRGRNLTVRSVFVGMPVAILLLSQAPQSLAAVVGIVFVLGA